MPTLEPGLVRRIGECVAAHAGLCPPEWVLEARLARRIDALGLERPELYAELIETRDGGRELELLVELLRVGETRFFRHRAHVKAVTDVVIPALLRARAGGSIRAWSAGCATGEEPYTLAILLARALPAPTYCVSVLASDISVEALDAARAAEYPSSALDQVPDDVRSAFEPAGEGRMRIAPAISGLVTFEQRNLADPDYPRRIDLVWCRNVLIYFSAEARRQVVLRLIDSLAPGGFLFVGYAETLRDFAALETVRTPDAVLYRKPAAAPGRAPPERPVASGDLARAPRTPPPASRSGPAAATAGLAVLQVEEAVVELRGRYDGGLRLAEELGAMLSGSYRRVVIDLDGAAYLDDAAGQVLRRACSAARAAGIEVSLVAERQSTRRWLSRSGALGEEGR